MLADNVCQHGVVTCLLSGQLEVQLLAVGVQHVLACVLCDHVYLSMEVPSHACGTLGGSLTGMCGAVCCRDVVRGVRWLGATPRLVSFSSERLANGFRNCICITDACSRRSTPFRCGGLGRPVADCSLAACLQQPVCCVGLFLLSPAG